MEALGIPFVAFSYPVACADQIALAATPDVLPLLPHNHFLNPLVGVVEKKLFCFF